jgi:hypothetical protein
VDQGRVVGVETDSGGKSTTIRVFQGVVLATGQYDSNPRLMALFDEFNSWPPRGAPRNQGDGLVLAAEKTSTPSFGISTKMVNPNFSAASLSSTVIVVASMDPA